MPVLNGQAFKIKFLGVGGAGETGLGHASMVVETEPCDAAGRQKLLVDCGPKTLARYTDEYGELPSAVYISHAHLDHIADLEGLFFNAWFQQAAAPPKLFVPVSIVECLHQRLATYPGALAEGGVNFWQAFQLIPVSEAFFFAGNTFFCYPARHHAPNSAFSLHLPGVFFFSGDTRPVPEIISHKVCGGEWIFHDVSLPGNPSHAGLEDLEREYTREQQQRMWLYHYRNNTEAERIAGCGFKPLRAGDTFTVVKKGANLEKLAPEPELNCYRESIQTNKLVSF